MPQPITSTMMLDIFLAPKPTVPQSLHCSSAAAPGDDANMLPGPSAGQHHLPIVSQKTPITTVSAASLCNYSKPNCFSGELTLWRVSRQTGRIYQFTVYRSRIRNQDAKQTDKQTKILPPSVCTSSLKPLSLLARVQEDTVSTQAIGTALNQKALCGEKTAIFTSGKVGGHFTVKYLLIFTFSP